MSPSAHLVTGPGNPGSTYAPTQYNVGLWAVDDLASRLGARFGIARGQQAEVVTGQLPSGCRLMLMKSTIYMSDSETAVAAIARFHETSPADVIVIHDELDLEPTRLCLRLGGGDNGYDGLKFIHTRLGTGDFHRVRASIDCPLERQPVIDYVPSRMRLTDLDAIRPDAAIAVDAAETLVTEGLAVAQNRLNS